MFAALASADGVQWISIIVKAVAYAATLVAAGSVLVLIALRGLDNGSRRTLRRYAIGAALLAAIDSALRIPVRASFLTGGTLDGATDPMLLGMVGESPLGASILIRLAGLALILALAFPLRGGLWVATVGAVVASASFAFRGHALEDPRAVLSTLVTLHILGLAFWIGGFAPLLQSVRQDGPRQVGALAHEFGRMALWVVGGLTIAGVVTLGTLTGWRAAELFSPYGQFFALKLLVFAAVLGLAAVNKIRLTPALRRGDPQAATDLASSIRLEAALIAVILLVTAALTTITSPPRAAVATWDAGQDNDNRALYHVTSTPRMTKTNHGRTMV